MSELLVSELAIYPVKSLAQVGLSSSLVELGGLKHDRRWMIVDSEGYMLTQRKLHRMCLIQPVLNNMELKLTMDGESSLTVVPGDYGNLCSVRVWNDTCRAIECGNEASGWLSHVLKTDCRLVYFPDDSVRQVDINYAQQGDRTAFSDGFPVLITTQASLDDLNQRIEREHGEPVPMARFRPNIVISGSEAYAEDNWQRIKINGMLVRIVKPCSRCVIPSIDFMTGLRGEEPTRTLVKYRKRDNKIFFGQNAVIDGDGSIELGMSVKIVD